MATNLDDILDNISLEDASFNEPPLEIGDETFNNPTIVVVDEEPVTTENVDTVYEGDELEEAISLLERKLILAKAIDEAILPNGPLDGSLIKEAIDKFAYGNEDQLMLRTDMASLSNLNILKDIRTTLRNSDPNVINPLIEKYKEGIATLGSLLDCVDEDNTSVIDILKNKVFELRSNILITKDSSISYTETNISDIKDSLSNNKAIYTDSFSALMDIFINNLEMGSMNLKQITTNLSLLQGEAVSIKEQYPDLCNTIYKIENGEGDVLEVIYNRDKVFNSINTLTKLNSILKEFDLINMIENVFFNVKGI